MASSCRVNMVAASNLYVKQRCEPFTWWQSQLKWEGRVSSGTLWDGMSLMWGLLPLLPAARALSSSISILVLHMYPRNFVVPV